MAANTISNLEERIRDLENQQRNLQARYADLKATSEQEIAGLVGQRQTRTKKMWGLLTKSVKLRGFAKRFATGASKNKKPDDDMASVLPQPADDDEDPQQRMIETMERNVALVERTKLEMSNVRVRVGVVVCAVGIVQ